MTRSPAATEGLLVAHSLLTASNCLPVGPNPIHRPQDIQRPKGLRMQIKEGVTHLFLHLLRMPLAIARVEHVQAPADAGEMQRQPSSCKALQWLSARPLHTTRNVAYAR